MGRAERIAVASLLAALAPAGVHAETPPPSRAQGAMNFVITRVSGFARHGRPESRIIGQTRAATPSAAVWRFIDKSHRSWKEHADSRTRSYVRVENPASFVADIIDYYEARAGRVVVNDKGQTRYTCTLSSDAAPGEPDVLETRRVWATSPAQAALMCLDSGQTGWRPGEESSAWFATLSSPPGRSDEPSKRWEVHADVQTVGEVR